MRRVAQRRATDCGIAAVATIANVSYEEAKAAFPCFQGRGFATTAKDVRGALKRLGVRLGRERDKRALIKLRAQGHDGLLNVLIRGRRGRDVGHWIVWDASAGELLDPLRKTARARYRIVGVHKLTLVPPS